MESIHAVVKTEKETFVMAQMKMTVIGWEVMFIPS